MTTAHLILANLRRNRVRTLLTVASIAVSLFLFTLLQAAVGSMKRVAAESQAQLRLVVHHKATMTRLLPLNVGRRIAALPGVKAVCGVRWFGGRLAGSDAQFASVAAETDSFEEVYRDFTLTADELTARRRTRNAAVIGADLARRMDWQRGRTVTLRSSVPPYPSLEFRIVGITDAEAYRNVFSFRLDYLLETLRTDPHATDDYVDAVFFFWVKAQPDQPPDELARRIDALFARTPHATKSEPEQAFVGGFVRLFGDIPRMIGLVGLIAIGGTLLVVCNTISMSVRERSGELAVLRAVGFGPARIVRLVLLESAALGLSGGLAGLCLAVLAVGWSSSGGAGIPYFPAITLSPAGAVGGVLTGVACGLLAGLIPAWSVQRQPVAAALRSVD